VTEVKMMSYLRPRIRLARRQDQPEVGGSTTVKASSFVWVQHHLCSVWHRGCCRPFLKVERAKDWVIIATSQVLCVFRQVKINDITEKGFKMKAPER